MKTHLGSILFGTVHMKLKALYELLLDCLMFDALSLTHVGDILKAYTHLLSYYFRYIGGCERGVQQVWYSEESGNTTTNQRHRCARMWKGKNRSYMGCFLWVELFFVVTSFHNIFEKEFFDFKGIYLFLQQLFCIYVM
mgnify:CR=1 FL=1